MLFAEMDPQPNDPKPLTPEELFDLMLLEILLSDMDVVVIDVKELFANEPVCPNCGLRHPQL